ncbi:MAG: alpha/beta hydrolase family protein, partial [Myxococcota bacterium]
FKAAVAQRGVYDLRTFYGEGNAWQLVEWAFGGPPFDPRFKDIIERSSPINFVQRIRTPLLIEHGSSDLRTGVSQSEMLYRSLKVLNKPVEYLRYPGAGHDMSRSGDPTQRMDRLNRIIEFFERHVSPGGETPSTGDR